MNFHLHHWAVRFGKTCFLNLGMPIYLNIILMSASKARFQIRLFAMREEIIFPDADKRDCMMLSLCKIEARRDATLS